jgi:hypothetical protein
MYRLGCLAGDTADLIAFAARHAAGVGRRKRCRTATGRGSSHGGGDAGRRQACRQRRGRTCCFSSAACAKWAARLRNSRAAIDMNRSHLQMLLKKHGIHSKDFRAGRLEEKS